MGRGLSGATGSPVLVPVEGACPSEKDTVIIHREYKIYMYIHIYCIYKYTAECLIVRCRLL